MQASKAQLQVMDQLLEAWQKQMTSPAPDQFLAQLRALPASFGSSPMPAPMEFWMQAAEMWQRNWVEALSAWTGGASKGH